MHSQPSRCREYGFTQCAHSSIVISLSLKITSSTLNQWIADISTRSSAAQTCLWNTSQLHSTDVSSHPLVLASPSCWAFYGIWVALLPIVFPRISSWCKTSTFYHDSIQMRTSTVTPDLPPLTASLGSHSVLSCSPCSFMPSNQYCVRDSYTWPNLAATTMYNLDNLRTQYVLTYCASKTKVYFSRYGLLLIIALEPISLGFWQILKTSWENQAHELNNCWILEPCIGRMPLLV